MEKKVLLISYHFPPSAEVGGLRAANFARHLARFGWAPYVLTLKDKYLEKVDEAKLKFVEQVIIAKAGRMPSLAPIYVVIKRFARSLVRSSRGSTGIAVSLSQPGKPVGKGAEAFTQKLRRYILSFLSLPDEQRSWMWPAVIQGVRLIRRKQIDCILTSGPPYSVHLVGRLVKGLTGTRWIADFRDPWMTGGSKKLFHTCAVSLAIERWLERQVVQNADLVLATTEKLCGAFGKAFGDQLPGRFVCITNGFDGEFFSRFENFEKDQVFTIIYAGTLYFGRTPEPVFQAVHELIEEGQLDARAIRIRLVGQCQVINNMPIEEIVLRHRLDKVVQVMEPVPYYQAIEMVKQSHMALLLAPNQPFQIPAKVYDYIGVRTRILALAEEGATSDLIQSTGVGDVFSPSDIQGLKQYIREAVVRWDEARVLRGVEGGRQFEIGHLTSRLAHQLNRICQYDQVGRDGYEIAQCADQQNK